jgi:hypothetical protein
MPRPSPLAFTRNWRASNASFAEKVAMLRKNTAIKIKNNSDCCGNHGEVGC